MKNTSTHVRFFLMGFIFLAAGLIAGCAPRYSLIVDSIEAPAAPEGKDYVLLPGMRGLSANDLHFKAYAATMVRVLEDRGYRQAAKKEDCQLLIYLSYGIGEPKPTTYAQFAGMPPSPAPPEKDAGTPAESTRAGSLPYYVVRPYPFPDPDYYYHGHRFYPRFGAGYPPFEIYALYQRYMILEAVDYRASKTGGEVVPVWKVTVSHWGERNDLREIFPALAVAAGDYIGTNTNNEVTVNLSENDARLRHLKEPR